MDFKKKKIFSAATFSFFALAKPNQNGDGSDTSIYIDYLSAQCFRLMGPRILKMVETEMCSG